jgi:16S rRNA (adenine1518-N6/adenine1519-N6)-dimethyltransferase
MPLSLDYDSPASIISFLETNEMAMQKKFGQNFLINSTSRKRLVDALELDPSKKVWEIGPGLGAMTESLLDSGATITAFEIDRGFAKALRTFFSHYENFNLIEGDVLRTWQNELKNSGVPDCLFGNLPYNIAAAILGDLISAGIRFETVVITVQKEVALRMAAKPDSEDYSSFSILCQWAYDVKPLMDLAGGSFYPRPNVTSRAVILRKKKEWPCCKSPVLFMAILRALFSSRRKTIKNNFVAWITTRMTKLAENTSSSEIALDLLAKAAIDPAARAETLSVKDFLNLSDAVFDAGIER